MRKKISVLTNNLIKIISNNNLFKNILTLSGGTAIAQLINIISQPIITRLYTPEEYGALTVFASLLLIFRISSLRYEMAIPVARNDKDAVNLVAVSLLTLSTITGCILLILIFFGDSFLGFLNANELRAYKFFIPIGIFLQGLFLIFTEWMYRKKNFKIVSKRTVTQSISGSIFKIIFGFINIGGVGLIIGNIIATGSGTLPLVKRYLIDKKESRIQYSVQNIKYTFKKYKDYPLFQTPSSLFLHLRNQLPILMLAPLYGGQIVGYFGLANQIIQIPMTLIGQSVMNVFFAEIASLGRHKPLEIKKMSDELFRKLFLLGIFPMIILLFFGPFLFETVFGNDWREAGIYARILSIYVFANFLFSPISRVFEVFSKQGIKVLIDSISLLFIFLVFSTAHFIHIHHYVLITFYSISMFMLYLVTYLISKRILNDEIKFQKRVKVENN